MTGTKVQSFLATDRQTKRAEMLAFFQSHPAIKFSRHHLEQNLHWRTGSVCGRVKELLNRGEIEVVGTMFDYTTKRDVELLRLRRR